MDSIYLSRLQTLLPKNRVAQSELLNWIVKCHQKAESFGTPAGEMNSETIAKLFQRFAVKESQISHRYLECSDVFSDLLEDAQIYKINSVRPNGADISERARFFTERSLEVFKKFYPLPTREPWPDHLVHVTCTGYVSPSAAQLCISQDGWGHETAITHAYHMGCYASLPAIRMAKALAESDSLNVDVVHNEMCGLHMNALAQTPEQMIVQTLFADGHAKYTVSKIRTNDGQNLKILAINEKIIPHSDQDMSWVPATFGMQMNLSREVPGKIKSELGRFAADLFAKANLSQEKVLASIFAIHPGGPKIIEAVQESMGLNENQISESRKVLFERGNMSSATLPHVWEEILKNKYPLGTTVVSFAFGPGLTVFGSVFEVA